MATCAEQRSGQACCLNGSRQAVACHASSGQRVAWRTGALLRSVDRWNEAEIAPLDALTPTASHSTVLRSTPAAELADLRVVQGRLEEAAALLRTHEDRIEVCGALARLHLARGEPALAAAAINRALRQLVADRLRQGELLALL